MRVIAEWCTVFQTKVTAKTKQAGKSHKFCGGRHCFRYCSWPLVQQKSCLLIGLNCILYLNDNSNAELALPLSAFGSSESYGSWIAF